MKYSQIIVGAAMAAVANAHARVWSIAVDGVSQGNGLNAGGYIRSPPNNNPLKDLTSNDLRCNVNNSPAAKTIDVKAGAKVTVQWYHDIDSASDDIIDPSHKGPVMVYLAPTASNGAGPVWVKVSEEGYSGGKWAVDNLIANRGKHSFIVPAALAAGEYLVRPEIIASHESDTAYNVNPARGAQLYMACIQIRVTAGGSTPLPAGVAIPGVYSYSDPGILFNYYSSYTSYTIPGPKVWTPSSGGNAPAPAPPAATTTKAATTTVKPITAPTTTSSKPVVAPTTTQSPVVPTKAPVIVAPKPTTTVAPIKPSATSVPTAPAGGASATKYGQCGGIGFTGPKACVSGSTCTKQNDWYSQCL